MANQKIDMKVLESFMTRAQQAARMGSKELRVPMPEGYELAIVIGQVLARNVALVEQINEIEKLVGSSMRVDGGGFN